MNIKRSNVDALKALGYAESEARFLYIVPTDSGYFVAPQFLAFTCGHWGKRTATFRSKLHTKKHARTEYFPASGKLCHLFCRWLYRQIGRENLRNRREHEFEYIRLRIAMLDFVLSHPQWEYLETDSFTVVVTFRDPRSAGSSFATAPQVVFSTKSRRSVPLQDLTIGKSKGTADAPGSARFSSAHPPNALWTSGHTAALCPSPHAPSVSPH